jgi:hypothetical protein
MKTGKLCYELNLEIIVGKLGYASVAVHVGI